VISRKKDISKLLFQKFLFLQYPLQKQKQWVFLFLLFFIILVIVPNWIILKSTETEILKNIVEIKKSETGIILGAAVYGNKYASPIVLDRIITAANLYKAGKVRNLLISGDHRQKYYNEVRVIKNLLLARNIPEKDIMLDHSGFSTYESIFRAKNVFGVKDAVIITQSFHLPRAVFLAQRQGMDAQGFCADRRVYRNNLWYIFREYLARVKDFFYVDVFRHIEL